MVHLSRSFWTMQRPVLTLKGSGHALSAQTLQRPDERTHFGPPRHTNSRTYTCTEGCLDQRAAVLFGKLTSDPFRAAHTGASCSAEAALLEFE